MIFIFNISERTFSSCDFSVKAHPMGGPWWCAICWLKMFGCGGWWGGSGGCEREEEMDFHARGHIAHQTGWWWWRTWWWRWLNAQNFGPSRNSPHLSTLHIKLFEIMAPSSKCIFSISKIPYTYTFIKSALSTWALPVCQGWFEATLFKSHQLSDDTDLLKNGTI